MPLISSSLFKRVVMGHPLRDWVSRVGRLLGIAALAFAAGGLLIGCGRGTVIGRQYDDLTAYYNTFHNAQKAFEKGVESVSQSDPEVDRTRYISIFPTPQSGSGSSSFEKAIKKSADVLREHPNSEWVDDALLLIGRARYYQQNYAGAAQKFREVITLGNDRVGEARFRLAKTLVAADRFSEAAEALRTGLEQEADFGTWTAQMHLVQGELFVRQEDWTSAEAALTQGLDGPLPGDVGARAALLLGQVRETLEKFEEAQLAYERVLEYDPKYPLEFAAQLGAIEMQGRHGDARRALQRLEDLERDDDTKAMRGQIAIVRARLYKAMGRPKKARQVLTGSLRKEEAPTGKVQGRIHYDLATLYRDTYEDFTRAAAHFDTAATKLSTPSASGGEGNQQRRMLPRAPSDAAGQAERFRGLADRAQRVARLDSLLRLGRMPPAEFRTYVKKLRRKRLEKQREKAEAKRRRQQQFRGGQRRTPQRQGEAGPAEKSAVQQAQGSDAGFLFHRDPALVQEGRRQFEQTWGDRPLVDNWRRVTAIQGQGPQAAQRSAERGLDTESAVEEQLVDVSAVPRDSASRAKMRANRAVAQYELANALFRAAGRPDSAETWYRRILDENEDHTVARQALYGLAQAHRAQGDTAAGDEAYRRIIEEYPGTPYAKRAREQLGLASATPGATPKAGRADSAYGRAYEAWRRGKPHRALGQFLSVARRYPNTEMAPRALLAAGVMYHRFIRSDTSDTLGVRFERYVDSLAQTNASTRESPSRSDTLSLGATDSTQVQPPADSAVAQRSPRRARDTSGARTTARSVPARPQRDPDGIPKRQGQAVPDSTQKDTTRRNSRSRPRPARLSDSTEIPSRGQSPSAPRDTTIVSRASADRSTASPDSAATLATTTSDTSRTAQGEKTDPFQTLLAHLTQQYSDSPVAKRAQALLDHLEKRQAASAKDTSSAMGEQPSTRSSPPSAPDSARTRSAPERQSTRPDSLAAPTRDSTASPTPRLPADTTREEGQTPG